ncbi:MAG: hypothetical protein F4Z28_03240 [Gammaproteobacteria bacterium]|nr:hypothetical protein [Gammaproteobacteria bacterium]
MTIGYNSLLLFVFTGSVLQAGPFDELYLIEDVSTSRDGRWISASLLTETYSAKVPGYTERVIPAMGPKHQWIYLGVECRAGPATDNFPAAPAVAEIAVPDHPDQKPHNWWSPMYWILGLSGRDIEKTPVTVTLSDAGHSDGGAWHKEDVMLERYRTDYSAVRTLLSIYVDGKAVLDIMGKERPIRVRVRGEGTDIAASFPASPHLAPAVKAMQEHCS